MRHGQTQKNTTRYAWADLVGTRWVGSLIHYHRPTPRCTGWIINFGDIPSSPPGTRPRVLARDVVQIGLGSHSETLIPVLYLLVGPPLVTTHNELRRKPRLSCFNSSLPSLIRILPCYAANATRRQIPPQISGTYLHATILSVDSPNTFPRTCPGGFFGPSRTITCHQHEAELQSRRTTMLYCGTVLVCRIPGGLQ